MKISSSTCVIACLAAGGWFIGACVAADPATETVPLPKAVGGVRVSGGGRVVLPDPLLLDGSAHRAENKSEYGMIGDFEVPGDDNVRNGKVGGNSGTAGSQKAPDSSVSMPTALPAGGTGQENPAAKTAGGAGAMQPTQGNAAAANSKATPAAGGGGATDPKAAQKTGGGGGGEPIAQAQGIQVPELGGAQSGLAPGDAGARAPGAVSLGDKAMMIPQSTQSMAGVVGLQQPVNQNTQVYEKPTGTGGKGSTGTQGPNRAEKGRAIPAGL